MKKGTLLVVVVLILTTLTPQPTTAENHSLPADCYTNGYVDLQVCTVLPWDIPREELARGYYGARGLFVPGLPPEGLENYTPANHLFGNATYARRGFYNVDELPGRASMWGLNPQQFAGALATDSCGYVGAVAWIRLLGTGEWLGPFLVVDCASPFHQFERVCGARTVVELDYETFSQFQERGKLEGLEVLLTSTTDLSPPSAAPETQPLDYASSWLEASGLSCSL